ncbi:MAG: hypothetical protein U0U25_12580 [Flavobacteriales bacterium]
MDPCAFALGEKLKLRDLKYHLFSEHWLSYDYEGVNLQLANWETIKYLNDVGDDFSVDIDKLPDDEGGLYLFSVRCPIIAGMTEFPVYIGRALKTEHQSLRKRCRSYFTKYARNDERPLIHRMFKYWGPDLYLSFLRLADNAVTIEYEKKLINGLLLPCNDSIPDVKVQQAVNAFNL